MTHQRWWNIDEEGFLYITGRCKSLIILDNGKNIYPEELEEKILTINGVKDVCVYGDKGRICALIIPQDKDKKREIENGVKVINEELPTYKKITAVSFTNKEFPKTTTMKIKRHELLKMIQNQSGEEEVKIGLLTKTKTKTKAKDNAVFRLRYFISLFSFFSAFFSVYEVDDVCRL